MTTQAIVRSIGNGRRSMYVEFARTFVGYINNFGRRFFIRLHAAMAESRRQQADQILRRYRGLNDTQ